MSYCFIWEIFTRDSYKDEEKLIFDALFSFLPTQKKESLLNLLKPHLYGRPALLILNRHTTHLSVESIINVLKQKVYSFYIPVNTTHFL
jgi:hypothetical protein